jgi:putative proteasome-type protease
MTYCLGIITSSGLVFAADSRTNAGVDYVSTYRKLFDFVWEGDRIIVICTSGNLAITQSILTLIHNDLHKQEAKNLTAFSSMYDVASYVGEKTRWVQDQQKPWLQKDGIDAQCNLLVGGQISGEPPQLYLIYSQGNFIQATPETPFLQIGETKYGKPILDRTLHFDIDLASAAKCALLSLDSTMKSNISVGPPIHLLTYYRDSFIVKHRLQLKAGDPFLIKFRQQWEIAIRQAFEQMPDIDWGYSAPAVNTIGTGED